MRRALTLAATPGVPRGPNPRVGCVLLDPAGTTVAEGFHRGAGTPARRGRRAGRGRARSPRRHRRGHPRAVQPHRPHRAVRRGAARRRGRRVVLAQSDPNPVAAGGADRLAAAGVDVVRGRPRRRGGGAQRGVDLRRRARPPDGHLEGRHHPRRPHGRRRRHEPVDHRARRPARRSTGCAPRSTRSSSAPAPPWPTTRP